MARWNWRWVAAVAAAGMTVCLAGVAGAQEAAAEPRVDARADKLNYDRTTGWIDAEGNVVVVKGDQQLRCDKARVNVQTEDVHAEGNVILRRTGQVWRGLELNYNFRTRIGNVLELAGGAGPFRLIRSDTSEQTADGVFVLRKATVTTCSNRVGRVHYRVRARSVEVQPDEYLKARGAVWFFGPVPVVYIPYWYRDLDGSTGFRFRPGYSSRWGAFLLSSYRFRVAPQVKAETHLDLRSERGVAVGQDFRWRTDRSYGDFIAYYADDQEPIDEDEDPETTDIESERYRFRFRHAVDFTGRDSLLMQADYHSDTDVLEDFFEREYRYSRQPDNYVSYTHRDDRYTANADVRGRLNDFYEGVNELPEVSGLFMRQRVMDTAWYYEGQTALGHYERVFEETSSAEDYDATRFDTEHTVFRPSRHFGFLNVIPRVGFRGTYYSDTRETVSDMTVTTVATTNLVVSGGTTNTVVEYSTDTVGSTRDEPRGSEFRTRFELGLETSFKAFKIFHGANRPLRHVIEPYANYTLVPEPSALPDDLYQFDSVDRLDEEHFVQLGLRNKLQTKMSGYAADLVDVELATRLNIEKDEGEETIGDLLLDAEITPSRWLRIDVEGLYDTAESEIAAFNTRAIMAPPGAWRANAEYRYLVDDSSLLAGDLTASPNRDWTLNVFGRYEMEESRLEEIGGYMQRNLDCMVVRAGLGVLPGYTRSDGSERDDEWRFLVHFWLTAFPEFSAHAGHLH